MDATFIHNPNAGGGDHQRHELIAMLHDAGITPFYQSSKTGELSAVLERPCDLIVVGGGDGTVAKVLTQMPRRDTPVAILPLGTANNIASSFGIGGALEEIAVGLHTARPRRLDVGLATGPWGACRVVEGIGLGALVRTAQRIGKPNGSREDRLTAARKALRREVGRADPDRVRVLVDGEPVAEESLLVEVLNIRCGGPRLPLAPATDPGDGLLDVVVLEPARRKAMRRWLKAEQPSDPPPVAIRRGRRVSLVWDGTPLHVDDDIPPVEDSPVAVELELEEQPVTILAPAVQGEPGVAE